MAIAFLNATTALSLFVEILPTPRVRVALQFPFAIHRLIADNHSPNPIQ